MSLDRINNDGNYEPGNCRWTDAKTQGRNSRNAHYVEYRGESKCVAEWAEILGLKPNTLHGALRRGLSIEEVVKNPPRSRQKTSRYKGVHFVTRSQRWAARNGDEWLGQFKTEAEAVQATGQVFTP